MMAARNWLCACIYLLVFLTTVHYCVGQCGSSTKTLNSFCPFFNNRAPKPNPHLKNCTWYSESSCCRQEEIDSIFSKVKPLQGASKDCQRYINYLMCYICAPTQNKFYKRERLFVCEDFCDNLYDACKSAILSGSVISNLYSNGRDFCTSRRFIVTDEFGEEDERQCFTKIDNVKTSKGPRTKASPLMMVLILLTSCLFCTGPHNESVTNIYDHKQKKSFKTKPLPQKAACHQLHDSHKPLSRVHSNVWIYITIHLLYLANVADAMTSSNVTSWARLLSTDLLKLSHDGMKDESAQELYNNADYIEEVVNGTQKVKEVKAKLDEFFSSKIQLVTKLVETAGRLYDGAQNSKTSESNVDQLSDEMFKDADSMAVWSGEHQLRYSSKFGTEILTNGSVVKLSSDSSRKDKSVIKTAIWTSRMDSLFTEIMQKDPDIRWQYFGSNTGLLRTFPGRDWPRNHIGFHTDYDPRLRPWYISATSGPKNMVIILDASYSMGQRNRFELAKKTIGILLQTLSKDDRVNIVIGKSSYYSENGKHIKKTPYVLSCGQDRLVQATSSNKRQLLASLEEVNFDGGSKFEDSIRKAYDLLDSEAHGCHNIVFFVSDVEYHDGTRVRCGAGYYKYDEDNTRRFMPGDKCKYDWDELPGFIKTMEQQKHTSAAVFPLIMENRDVTSGLECAANTMVLKLSMTPDVLGQMDVYFNYLAKSSGYDHVVVTAPYLDSGGLGLVFTLSAPVYSNKTKDLIGVIGVDVSLTSIESLLTNEAWGSAYAFLIDTRGHALIHPSAPLSTQLVGDPVYGDIGELEVNQGNQDDFEPVIVGMIRQEEGMVTIHNAERAVYSDGRVVWQRVPYTRYFYAGINNSEYSVGFSMADSDEYYRYPVSPPGGAPVTHVLNNGTYNVGQQGGDVQVSSVYEYSAVTLAARSFCNPQDYLNKNLPSSSDIERYLDSERADECPTGLYHKAVRPDVKLTASLEQLWKNRPQELQEAIPWTYVGTASGVMRLYPAAPSSRTYDPTRRPWYLHALSNKGKLAVSSVYQDDAGIGKVVTLSRTIHTGTGPHSDQSCGQSAPSAVGCMCMTNSDCESQLCLNSRCVSSVVHAVIAIDMRYPDLDRRVRALSHKAGINCDERCYLLDESGDFVINSGLSQVADDDRQGYEKKSLASQHGYVFNELRQKGIFRQHSRTDYQGKCVSDKHTCTVPERQWGPIKPYPSSVACVKTVKYYSGNWNLAQQLGLITGDLSGDPCGSGKYFFTVVPDTNLYLLVMKEYEPRRAEYSFNCHISDSVHAPGSFPLLDRPCQEPSNTTSYRLETSMLKCPVLREVLLTKDCNQATANHRSVQYMLMYVIVYVVYEY